MVLESYLSLSDISYLCLCLSVWVEARAGRCSTGGVQERLKH
jgi:hypothetical protein